MVAAIIGRTWVLWPAALAAAVTAGNNRPKNHKTPPGPIQLEPCVQALLAQDGAKVVPSAGQMLRKNGIAGRLIAQDHWFDMMECEQMVKEMVCVYNADKQQFHTVVRVGRDVCGYPRTVHGGLTAAIADETFGGLYVCTWLSGKLGATLPALTAKLEVDYVRKLTADTVIVCSTELESTKGRKVWMRAVVTDGRTGKVCANARALFVSPRWAKMLRSLLPF